MKKLLAYAFMFVCINFNESAVLRRSKKNLERPNNCWVCFQEAEYKRLDKYWWARYYDEPDAILKPCPIPWRSTPKEKL